MGSGESGVGVCYGMLGNDLPDPVEVVKHCGYHKIKRIRLYWPKRSAMEALRGSGIELILDIPREHLETIAKSGAEAGKWVHDNVMEYYPHVLIKYITVGNEVILNGPSETVLPAMKNVYNALEAANLHTHIKVSTAIHGVVLGESYPPSEGAFSSAAMMYMAPIVQYLSRIGSPLLCNVYPYFAYRDDRNISLDFALFKSPGTVVTDGNFRYQNLFDAMVDSIYAAMERVGGRNVPIVVSETGWPWKGDFGANLDNAGSYNWHIIDHVRNGTPRRPQRLETYIFAMFNENQKEGKETEKYFGLFYPNRKPVYPLKF